MLSAVARGSVPTVIQITGVVMASRDSLILMAPEAVRTKAAMVAGYHVLNPVRAQVTIPTTQAIKTNTVNFSCAGVIVVEDALALFSATAWFAAAPSTLLGMLPRSGAIFSVTRMTKGITMISMGILLIIMLKNSKVPTPPRFSRIVLYCR